LRSENFYKKIKKFKTATWLDRPMRRHPAWPKPGAAVLDTALSYKALNTKSNI